MKTIMKIALFLSAIAFAASANAQTFGGTLSTAGTPAAITPAQIDFVTVGSTMPYATTAQDISGWRDLASDIPGLNLDPTSVTQSTTWTIFDVDANALVGGQTVTQQNSVNVNWANQGHFRLNFANQIHSCTAANSVQDVFVLPAPNAERRGTTHGTVLCPAAITAGGDFAAGFPVQFTVRGIGEIRVRYTVERRVVGGGTTDDPEFVGQGEVQTNVGNFFETTTFAAAQALYLTNNTRFTTITVDDLAPGFVYIVTITGVSDQISRKSFAGNLAYIAPADPVTIAFAVTPDANQVVIEHVSNIPTP